MSLAWNLAAQAYTGANVNTLTSPTFSVSAGDWIVVAVAYRDDAIRTINTPTVSGAVIGPWTEVDSGEILDSSSSRYTRIRISAAQVTTGGGAVTVTTTTSAAVFNLMLEVGLVTGGATGVLQTASATGTSNSPSLSFGSAMTADAAAIAAIVEIGFDTGTEAVASDAAWTDDPAIGGSPVGMLVSHAVGSGAAPPSTVTWTGTGISANHGQAMAGIELEPPPSTKGGMMLAA